MGWWCSKCGMRHDTPDCPEPYTTSSPGEHFTLGPDGVVAGEIYHTSDDDIWRIPDIPSPVVILSWTDIRLKCIKELGYALVYMQYLRPCTAEDGTDTWEDRRARVTALCEELVENMKTSKCKYWDEFHRRIRAETENMY